MWCNPECKMSTSKGSYKTSKVYISASKVEYIDDNKNNDSNNIQTKKGENSGHKYVINHLQKGNKLNECSSEEKFSNANHNNTINNKCDNHYNKSNYNNNNTYLSANEHYDVENNLFNKRNEGDINYDKRKKKDANRSSVGSLSPRDKFFGLTDDDININKDNKVKFKHTRVTNFFDDFVTTPLKYIRNYYKGNVVIREVDLDQPCNACSDCPGFSPHPWRKTCSGCKCPREAHAIYHDEYQNVSERLGFKSDVTKGGAAGATNNVEAQTFNYAWVPPGLTNLSKIEDFFKTFPPEKVPLLGTSGERYRDKQLLLQLPKQDLALTYCKHVPSQCHSSYEDFVAARNEIALDIGYVIEAPKGVNICHTCHKPVSPGSLCVTSHRFGGFETSDIGERFSIPVVPRVWHSACFVCEQCQEPLVDLAHCVHEGSIYCERHYAELLKPRCAACDELIFSGEYTKAMNKDWHGTHFCCWQCDESLTGQRYVLRDDHPYCVACYESVFANGCEECNKIIGIDSKDLSYKDKHWHEACFLCTKCRVSLVDKQFGSKLDKIYCGNCYDAQFASRCDGCGEIFRAGTKKMEYKTRQWHEKCFCCCVCKTAIGTKSFIPREQEIYCAQCYEEKFATRCVKCNKIITSGGVTYKNEPWHRECFTCSNCNTSLAGQRFTSRDEKPYCADCFGELFAKRCTACSKPITGIGGTRFISFEERHWHNDCFVCATCRTSLVGRGFITDEQDIICPDCAKAKLM